MRWTRFAQLYFCPPFSRRPNCFSRRSKPVEVHRIPNRGARHPRFSPCSAPREGGGRSTVAYGFRRGDRRWPTAGRTGAKSDIGKSVVGILADDFHQTHTPPPPCPRISGVWLSSEVVARDVIDDIIHRDLDIACRKRRTSGVRVGRVIIAFLRPQPCCAHNSR